MDGLDLSRDGGAGYSVNPPPACPWAPSSSEATVAVEASSAVDVEEDVTISESSPRELPGHRDGPRNQIDKSLRLTSTVTCMMTHVKDRAVDRYHD